MTTDEFLKQQEAKINAIIKENKPLEIAVRSVMALQSNRIFLQALNAEGGIIGNYVGGEIYISPNQNKSLPRFPLKGKSGEDVFKNGNKHKTGYFGNYLAFKKAIGRNKRTTNVDLFLTGELSRNWANAQALSQAQARKISAHNYIVALSERNANKVERYGNVFGISKSEKAAFLKVLQFEFTKAMQ